MYQEAAPLHITPFIYFQFALMISCGKTHDSLAHEKAVARPAHIRFSRIAAFGNKHGADRWAA